MRHIFVRDLGIKDECEEGNFLFTMYEDRKWVGFGHGIPGIVAPGPKKNVYNYPNGTTLRDLIPYPTPCFNKMAKYGFTVIGIWFIEDPWYIRCPKCHCN